MKWESLISRLKPYFYTFRLNMDEDTMIDYFIRFHHSEDISKVPLESLRSVGRWQHYGDSSYRGWSSLSKESLMLYIVEHFSISYDDFDIINANNDLFRIRL